MRLAQHAGALGAGLADALVDVGHLEADVDHAVAMRPVMVQQRAVGADAALEHEAAGSALQHVRLVVPDAGLRAGVPDQLHPEGGAEEVGGLGGVADDPDHGVPAGHRERVVALVVFHQADQLMQLIGVQAGQELVVGERGVGEHVGHDPRVHAFDNLCNRSVDRIVQFAQSTLGRGSGDEGQDDQSDRRAGRQDPAPVQHRAQDRGPRGQPATEGCPRHGAGQAGSAGARRRRHLLGATDLTGGPRLSA